MTDILKLGTRGSPLAVAQSTMMAHALARAHPGLTVELVRIVTTGDRMQAGPVKPVDSTKAIFTKELEEAILGGSVDFAVHSCKDLAASMPEALVLGAIPERAPVADVLVSRETLEAVAAKTGAVLGSGSLRRSLQWKERFPSCRFESLRGNIDTRIRKLRENEAWDGIILAQAGLERLLPDLSGLIVTPIPTDWVLPAPGQGALALQCRAADESTRKLIGVLDHLPTRQVVEIERNFLTAMDAGCHVPLGALAKTMDDELFGLTAVYYHENSTVGRRVGIKGPWAAANELIEGMAKALKAA
jgi:hydroxymethylbilane synthase